MEEKELSQLVRESQAGDPQARERLAREVQGYIVFYCRAIMKDEDAAMDAAQDIMLAMLSGLRSLREPDAFKGWLRKIIIRTCGKRLKREQRAQRLHEELAEQQLEDGPRQVDPDALLDRKETREAVWKLVTALPPGQRVCILMHYYDEMPVEEIAAALKVPVGTVKSRLYYARRSIKRGAEKYAGDGLHFNGLSPLPFLQ